MSGEASTASKHEPAPPFTLSSGLYLVAHFADVEACYRNARSWARRGFGPFEIKDRDGETFAIGYATRDGRAPRVRWRLVWSPEQ